MATATAELSGWLPLGFTPVDVQSIEAGKPPSVDLHHLVGEHLVLYCEAETVFTDAAKVNLLNSGILTLYAAPRRRSAEDRKPDLSSLLLLPNPRIHPQVKARALYRSAIDVTSRVLAGIDDCRSRQEAERLVGITVSHLARRRIPLKAILQVMRHDASIYTHSVNVCTYAVALGARLGFQMSDLLALGMGSLLHDAGKTRIPLQILNKPGPLTEGERMVVQQHPVAGTEMVGPGLTRWPRAKEVVLHHHERLDGAGYPNGHREADISPLVRVAALVDVYDALTSERPYRQALTPFEALRTIKEEMSHQLDMDLFASLVGMLGRDA